MKNSKNKAVVASTVAVPAKSELTINDIEVELPKGRPTDPTSARQLRLAKMAESNNKQGRPVNPKSARQAKLARFEGKIADGIEIKRGRPADPTSKRAAQIAAREAKILELKKAKLAEIEAAK
jgi:hypothetical protein